jgi:cytochrome oxidase assembly protein ShyY1
MSWPEVWSSRITSEQLLHVPAFCGSSHLIKVTSMYIVSRYRSVQSQFDSATQEPIALRGASAHSMNPVVLFIAIASPLTCRTQSSLFSRVLHYFVTWFGTKDSGRTLIGLLATGLLKRHATALPISA